MANPRNWYREDFYITGIPEYIKKIGETERWSENHLQDLNAEMRNLVVLARTGEESLPVMSQRGWDFGTPRIAEIRSNMEMAQLLAKKGQEITAEENY